jgi:hypothetical protein
MLSEMKEVSVLTFIKPSGCGFQARTFESSDVSTEIADSNEHL